MKFTKFKALECHILEHFETYFYFFIYVCVCPYEYCTTCVRGAEEGRSCWIPDARVVRRLWDPCLELGSEPWSWWRTVHMLKHGATAPVPFLRTFRTSDLQLGFLNLFEVTKKLVQAILKVCPCQPSGQMGLVIAHFLPSTPGSRMPAVNSS